MAKKEGHHSSKIGLPPGSIVYIGKKRTEKVKITVLEFSETYFEEKVITDISECSNCLDPDVTTWINVDGIYDTQLIEKIGKKFNLHPLLLEDIVNANHRPKMEEFDDYLYITCKMLGLGGKKEKVISEQISIVLGKGWVISFQEREGDIFEPFRERIRQAKGVVRTRKADYILYRLLDIVVDNYFYVTEHSAEEIEKLEEDVLTQHHDENLNIIHINKRDLVNLRKMIAPLREAITALMRDGNELISETTERYLRDVYEHVIHINDAIDSQREMVSSILDLYLSGVSTKMNQVMQVLTIFAAIFIPLTFIAGVYGMNFEYMPELSWKYSYFIVWGLMIVVALVLVVYFKKKKWL
jgi:magnesium transporter